MKFSTLRVKYKIIAFLSFILLIGLLIYLTYNTFVLNDQQYQNTEKLLIGESYSNAIRNDKLFPGGEAILNKHINTNMHVLDSLRRYHPEKLYLFMDSLMDILTHDLQEANTMDTVFNRIKNQYQLSDDWEYGLVLNRLRISLSNGEKIDLYPSEQKTVKASGSNESIRIGGKLSRLRRQNRITELNVSSPADYSYQATFSLYADRSNRTWDILKLISPVFILGLVAVVTIVFIYLATYRNWIRQKRLAEMKSDFINSITHEFNTPLSTILIANKTLKNSSMSDGNDTAKSLIDVIERQSIRLQRLFSQVLDITSIEKQKMQKEVMEINGLLADTIQDYKLKVTSDQIKLSLESHIANTSVKLNPFHFTSMMFNLLDNAIKHNPKEVKNVHVVLEKKNGKIRISISDNGEGIPNHELIRIFDKFYQSKSKNSEGLGLGLYYVQQCIEAHGWQIEAVNIENTGSQFIISIPDNLG